MRILLVEDDNRIAKPLAEDLRHQNYTVDIARDGIEGWDYIQSVNYDLILLDLMLPNGVSGFDVFDQIKQVPELQAIPVIVISAADPDEAMPKARKKGLSGFIAKPISIYIGKYIADVLKGKQVWIAESER